jgi:anaphase-promoting complex subunit 6
MTHRYSRAERLLTRPFSTKPPAVPFDVKGKAREPALPTRLPVGPAAMVDVAAEQQEGVSRLVDMSVVCRYLAAQCLVRQGKWAEATEMLGEANPFRNSGAYMLQNHRLFIWTEKLPGRSGPAVPNTDGGIKVNVIPHMYHQRC